MGALDHVQLHVVDNLADLDACRRWAAERRETPLAFDTESGGLDPYKHRHRMTQLGDLRHGWAFPAGWAGAAHEILAAYPGRLTAHNSPYDWRVLRIHAGLTPRWEATDDTMLMCHLADNLRPLGLKPRASMEVDSRIAAGEQALAEGMAAQRWTWDTVPYSYGPYMMYAALDPVATAHLHHRLAPRVLPRYQAAYDLERAVCRIYSNMMDAGMMIDIPFIEHTIARIRSYMEGSMAWLAANCGLSSVESNEQVGRALNGAGIPTLVRTGSGLPSVSKDTLRLYRTMYPQRADLIDMIAWCRKGGAIVGRYLGKFLRLAGPDAVMHYSIHSIGARRTGRSSVTDPPMQTYDRDEPAIRGAYRPRPGHVFITVDADQIEMRKAAHFSGDPRLIADFAHADANGLKFFVILASKIYGETVRKTDPRYTWCKNASYGQIYGAGLEKAAQTAGVPVDQMRPAYYGFRDQYPDVARMMARIVRDARSMRKPSVRTLYGKDLHCYPGKEYSLVDYLCQGSAAEVLKHNAVKLDAAGYGPYMRLTVHDEFLFEAPAADAPHMLRDITELLTDRTSFRVPLTWSGDILEDRWRKT